MKQSYFNILLMLFALPCYGEDSDNRSITETPIFEKSVYFEIRPQEDQTSNFKLPKPEDSESITAYFFRAGDIFAKRAGYATFEEAVEHRDFNTRAIYKLISNDIAWATEQQIKNAISKHLVAARKHIEDNFSQIDFSVVSPESQHLEPKISTRESGEGLKSYLIRNADIIANRIGYKSFHEGLRSNQFNLETLSKYVLPDLVNVSERQLIKIMQAIIADERFTIGEHGRFVKYKIRSEALQRSIHKLPASANRLSLKEYLKSILGIVVLRSEFKSLKGMLSSNDFNKNNFLTLLDGDILSVSLNSLSRSIADIIAEKKMELKISDVKVIEFSTRNPDEQWSAYKLPRPTNPAIGIRGYLTENLDVIAARSGYKQGFTDALNDKGFTGLVFADAIRDDLIGLTEEQLMSAIWYVLSYERKQRNISAYMLAPSFRDPKLQESSYKIFNYTGTKSLNELLYTNRDVIAKRAGFSSFESALQNKNFTGTKFANFAGSDITEVNSNQIKMASMVMLRKERDLLSLKNTLILALGNGIPETKSKQKLYGYLDTNFLTLTKLATGKDATFFWSNDVSFPLKKLLIFLDKKIDGVSSTNVKRVLTAVLKEHELLFFKEKYEASINKNSCFLQFASVDQ